MRKSPIKIKLKNSSTNRVLGRDEYLVTQITGAITVWQHPTIHVGDVINGKTAEALTRAYQVTVTV
jgi:hypothetical protein